MTDEIVNGAPEGVAAEPAVDLRSTIAAAVEKHRVVETPDEPDAPAEPVAKAADRGFPRADGARETEAERNERIRDEQGRFAKPDPAKAGEQEKVEPAKDGAADTGSPDAATVRAPSSWSPAAKVAFDKLPAEVKEAVSKREVEVNNGFAKLQEYRPIEKFSQMAKQSGTTLERALENYVGIENEMRRDLLGGVTGLLQRQGVHPVAFANAVLARYGAPPQQGDAGQAQGNQPPRQPDLSPMLRPIQDEVQSLRSYVEEQQSAQYRTAVDAFASDAKNTFYENVRAEMSNLLKLGLAENLQDAYDKACWSNPEIRALLIKQQAPAQDATAKAAAAVSRARAAAKATGGNPPNGFVPNSGPPDGLSLRETIRHAVNQQKGVV